MKFHEFYFFRYREVVKFRSRVINDRIVKPIDEAVYWVEYVHRHNGAYHLRTARNSLNFLQYHLIDLFIFVAIVVGSILVLLLVILRLVSRKINFGNSQEVKLPKNKKQK